MNPARDDASQELEKLLTALVEGELSYEQQQHLAALLRDDPVLQQKYRDYLMLDALLRWEQAEAAPAPRPRWSRRWVYGIGLGGLAAAAAAVLLVLLWPGSPAVTPKPQEQAGEPTDDTVAVLLQTSGAEWEGLPLRPGDTLLPGRLLLKSGFARLEFYNGATVILQGPAELQLVSRSEAYCARGKLRATVPPQAQGFKIGSPKLDLVDRGTEFGLEVGDQTEVHVFQGKVELYKPGADPKDSPDKKLKGGQGFRLGDPNVFPSDSSAFLTAQQLTERYQKEMRERQQQWLEAGKELRREPTLLAYYDFQAEDSWSRTLLDQAGGRQQPHDGAIVGCSWATGRWPGKQGLEFKQVSDRVRLHVSGEYDSLTLMAWVRVDGLPNVNNSLLMADGWEEGELHWQIGQTGTLILGVQGSPKGRGAHYHATDVITPESFGRWLHLAVVYDRDGAVITHYVNGWAASQVPLQFDIPVRIGDAEIGNWNRATHRNNTPIRHFTGCIDEVMVFSRALSEEEIKELHTKGRPPM